MDADVDVDVRVCGGETRGEGGGVWCERREGEIEEKIDLRGKTAPPFHPPGPTEGGGVCTGMRLVRRMARRVARVEHPR